MDQKLIGMCIGAMLVIGLFAGLSVTMESALAQEAAAGFVDADNDGICDNAQSGNCPYKNQANGFSDADGDGLCDNAANCPMHQNRGGCPRMREGFNCGCHHGVSNQ